MFKSLILWYFYIFLALDSLIGFLLKYKSYNLIVNPGQIVRGILLLLFLLIFFYRLQKGVKKEEKNLLFLFVFFVIFLIVLLVKTNSLSLFFDEFSHISKIIFILILIYYVSKHAQYYLGKLDKIMIFNFIIFSINLLVGYFTKIGLSAYYNIENTSKGMFYGGNPVAILSLVFFTYFLFEKNKNPGNIFFILISIFSIYITNSKVIFLVPFLFSFFLFLKYREKNVLNRAALSFLLLPVLIIAGLYFVPKTKDLYTSRYSKRIVKSMKTYTANEKSKSLSPLTPLAFVAFRRAQAAQTQLREQIDHPKLLFIGAGQIGQKNFWEQKNSRYHNASMDFIDIFFQYGLIGALLVFLVIFKTVFNILRCFQLNRVTIITLILFLYSFFGGHVISSASSGTVFALFMGISYYQMTLEKKRSLKMILKESMKKRFSWIKKSKTNLFVSNQ